MAMRIMTATFRYFVGFYSRAIRGDISDLAVTIFPRAGDPASSRTDFGQVALSSQIGRSPFAGTIVLGPFLLSLRTSPRASVQFTRGERGVTFVRRGEIPRRGCPAAGQCSPDQFGSPNQFGSAAGQRQVK